MGPGHDFAPVMALKQEIKPAQRGLVANSVIVSPMHFLRRDEQAFVGCFAVGSQKFLSFVVSHIVTVARMPGLNQPVQALSEILLSKPGDGRMTFLSGRSDHLNGQTLGHLNAPASTSIPFCFKSVF